MEQEGCSTAVQRCCTQNTRPRRITRLAGKQVKMKTGGLRGVTTRRDIGTWGLRDWCLGEERRGKERMATDGLVHETEIRVRAEIPLGIFGAETECNYLSPGIFCQGAFTPILTVSSRITPVPSSLHLSPGGVCWPCYAAPRNRICFKSVVITRDGGIGDSSHVERTHLSVCARSQVETAWA